MQKAWSLVMVGVLLAMLAGCGRLPSAPEESDKRKPNPVRSRTVTV